MIDNVGINTNIGSNSAFGMPNLSNNANMTKLNSLFDFKPSVNNYENDFMMGGLGLDNPTNFTASPQFETEQNIKNEVVQPQNVETSQITNPQPQVEDLGKLPTVEVPRSNVAKKFGGILGFLAPIAGCAVDLFKGVPASKVFNMKQLAVTCPLVALTGLGIGAFVDGCINANAQKAANAKAA